MDCSKLKQIAGHYAILTRIRFAYNTIALASFPMAVILIGECMLHFIKAFGFANSTTTLLGVLFPLNYIAMIVVVRLHTRYYNLYHEIQLAIDKLMIDNGTDEASLDEYIVRYGTK